MDINRRSPKWPPVPIAQFMAVRYRPYCFRGVDSGRIPIRLLRVAAYGPAYPKAVEAQGDTIKHVVACARAARRDFIWNSAAVKL